MLDLMSGDGFQLLRDFRHAGHDLIDIAETTFSKLLGAARRRKWAELGEPPRPEHPPRRYLADHGRFSTEPPEATWSGRELSHEQQQKVFEERHRQDAAEQLEWEAEQRRAHERRRESAAANAQETLPAGQPRSTSED